MDEAEMARRKKAFGDWNRDKLESRRRAEADLAAAQALEEDDENADDGITRWRPVLRSPITAPGPCGQGFLLV